MLKKIIYSFSIYTLTSVICALLNVFILPILTTYLSEEDYGTTALFSTYVMILTPLIGLSSSGYYWLEFFKADKNTIRQTTLFSTYFWLVIASAILVLALCATAFPFIKDFSYFSLFFILLIPATSVVSVIGEETRNYFINHKKPLSYLIYSVVLTLLEMALSYYFVVHVYKNWEGRIYAWIISLLLQFLVALWFFGVRQQYIRFIFSKEDLVKLALFGYPLVFHQLGKFVINQSDRLFIAKMISIDEAGIYSIGYQVGVMLLLPITAFSNFYSPFIYERLSKITEHAKVQIVKTGYAFIILIIVCFAALVLLAPYFFELFIDQKFHKGLQYVFWVALSYVFWGFYLLLTPIVFYQGKTMFLGFLSLLNIALNCLFNYVFINAFGAIGAAYATTLSFLIVFLVIAAYSSFLLPLPWLRPRVRESNSN